MALKELYEGPGGRHHQSIEPNVTVGENYGPLEQAAVHGWLSEEELDRTIEALTKNSESE